MRDAMALAGLEPAFASLPLRTVPRGALCSVKPSMALAPGWWSGSSVARVALGHATDLAHSERAPFKGACPHKIVDAKIFRALVTHFAFFHCVGFFAHLRFLFGVDDPVDVRS